MLEGVTFPLSWATAALMLAIMLAATLALAVALDGPTLRSRLAGLLSTALSITALVLVVDHLPHEPALASKTCRPRPTAARLPDDGGLRIGGADA